MNRYALLAFASLGLLPFAGCQQSGQTETTTTTERPTMTTPAAADTSYTGAYTPTVDTGWMQTATDTTSAGTLHPGDTVYLRTDAPTSGVVSAKTADGKMVYVRAADLKRK